MDSVPIDGGLLEGRAGSVERAEAPRLRGSSQRAAEPLIEASGERASGERASERVEAPPSASRSVPLTRAASQAPTFHSPLTRMPRWLRIMITASAFAMFFAATSFIGLVLIPLLLLFTRGRDTRRFTIKLNSSLRIFSGFMRDAGLIAYWPAQLPEGYADRPFLLIANHPSLIDVVLTLASLPMLSCVAKATWYDKIIMGPLLRRTEYVPGPSSEDDDELSGEHPLVKRLEEKLRSGVPMMVFPEGTRSSATELHRFGRGAIEAAIRAGVPILPMFIELDQPFLMKGQPFYDVPKRTAGYRFEFFEPIETAGRALDSKAVTRELWKKYQARWALLVAHREALARSLDDG